MKMLDLCCGSGGMSEGFAIEGFDVTGIDIIDAKALFGYKYNFIQADLLNLKGQDYQGFDVIHASPPCRDFSNLAHVGRGSHRRDGSFWKWKDVPNIERGLKLVTACVTFIEDARPRIWILENVPNLEKYLTIKPRFTKARLGDTMIRSFWGNFPTFLLHQTSKQEVMSKTRMDGKIGAQWKHAKIPLSCSLDFARACKQELRRILNDS
jgi:site-specific DNA-cytosine methylase